MGDGGQYKDVNKYSICFNIIQSINNIHPVLECWHVYTLHKYTFTEYTFTTEKTTLDYPLTEAKLRTHSFLPHNTNAILKCWAKQNLVSFSVAGLDLQNDAFENEMQHLKNAN